MFVLMIKQTATFMNVKMHFIDFIFKKNSQMFFFEIVIARHMLGFLKVRLKNLYYVKLGSQHVNIS